MTEKLSSIDDLFNRLIEGNRHPLVFTPFPSPLQNLCNPVRVVSCLNSSLTLRADRPFDRIHVGGRGFIRKVGKGDEGVIRVPVNLQRDGLTLLSEELYFDATPCIALKAYRIKRIFSSYQLILLFWCQQSCLRPPHHVRCPFHLRGKKAASQDSSTFDKVPPV